MIFANATFKTARVACLFATLMVALPAGCVPPVSVARKKAADKWVHMRSDISLQLAEEAFNTGDFEGARTKLTEILADAPADEHAQRLLARVYIETDEPDRAAELLHSIEGGDVADPQTYYLLGVTEELAQRFHSAATYYRLAAQGRPGHVPYIAAAVEALLADNDVAGASETLATTKRSADTTPQWLCLVAEVARAQHKFQRAADLYRRAMDAGRASTASSNSEESSWIAQQLADILQRLNRYAAAADILENLVKRANPEHINQLREQLAYCYLVTGRVKLAEQIIKTIDPHRTDQRVLWLSLARKHIDAANWTAATAAIKRVLSRDAYDSDALMLQTLVEIESGNLTVASRTLDRWRQTSPDDPMVETMKDHLLAGNPTYR